ncbi:MAG: M48 family metalloprotease [Bacillota bacterium]
MRLLDGLLLLLILLPPVLHLWQGRRMLAKGRSVTQVAAVSVAYSFVPILSLFYVMGTGFGERITEATGVGTASLLAIWLPLMLGQWLHLYPAYLLDRQARQVDWSFRDYLKANGRPQLLMTAFILPMVLVTPVLEFIFPEPPDSAVPLLVVGMLLPGALLAWATWRWSKIHYEPVEPALLARLTGLCAEFGLAPRSIEVMPLRGGKVANAFIVMGLRPGRPRILLTDYLVSTCSSEQVEVILAHEIGHAKLGHLRTRLWLTLGTVVVNLALGGGWAWLALRVLDLPLVLIIPPFALLGLLPALLITPLFRRQEFEADQWAARATGRGAELAATLEYLEQLNQVEVAKLPRWLRLMVGHPITAQRAAALREQTS